MVSRQELLDACRKLQEVFSGQPAVVEDSAKKVLVVGDVHGDLETIKYVQTQIDDYDRIVFVGDYVDRGALDLEVVCALPALAQNSKVVLLAGNHDVEMHITPRQFRERLLENFGVAGQQLIETSYVTAFQIAPIAYHNIEHKMLALHGGIPPNKGMFSPNGWHKYAYGPEAYHVVWNDFAFEKLSEPVYARPGVFVITDKQAGDFMRANDLELLIRGHQSTFFNTIYNLDSRWLVTVGSSSYYGNKVAFALPEKRFVRLQHDEAV